MNWEQVKTDWPRYRRKVKEKWSKLTDRDLATIAGEREQLAGILQKRYSFVPEQADQEVDQFVNDLPAPAASKGSSAATQPHTIETTHVAHESGEKETAAPTRKHSPEKSKQPMSDQSSSVTREQLIDLLNEDLAGEYQAIIAYVIYSNVLKGAQYMNIAEELKKHAAEELSHALTIAEQIDYLGGMPQATPKPVKLSSDAKEMLRADLQNENETVARYRQRVRQCEALGEYAMAEHIREILMDEQDHQISLATALGEEVPAV